MKNPIVLITFWGHVNRCKNKFPVLFLSVFFLPFGVFQVYVSYDYGKSFNKISEKLNFGVGNNSEAVISQFYHSPADNKRVRRLWLQGVLHSGKMAALKETGPWSPLLSLQHIWVTSYCF